MNQPLQGKVAVVAGGTRGAGRGIAVSLGAAGATVYVTGRSIRGALSDMGRRETIEETAEMINDREAEGSPYASIIPMRNRSSRCSRESAQSITGSSIFS